MIKSNDVDEIRYDIESQIEVLKELNHLCVDMLPCSADVDDDEEARSALERVKYFVRQYCIVDVPGFDELKAEHSRLVDEIEAVEI